MDKERQTSRRFFGTTLRSEAGFSLPETLIGAAVLVVIVGAIVPVLWISSGTFGGQSDRLTALDQDRVAFDDMTRLIREARAVRPVTDPGVTEGPIVTTQTLEVYTGDAERDPIVLNCAAPSQKPDSFKCVRSEANGAVKDLIDGVTNAETFMVDTGRSFVSVSLQLSPPQATNPVSLEGGVSLRAPVTG
jgi:type II secretory pathway pseudopilin PulG